jgi:hypothetical protein
MRSIGDELTTLIGSGEDPLVLVAPFVKWASLERVLRTCPKQQHVELFTRWRPAEVAAGISDLCVLDELRARGASLWLCDSLHAKYFRSGNRVLCGSANLTSKGLGWSRSSNLELAVACEWSPSPFGDFESVLRALSVRATTEIQENVKAAAECIPQSKQLERSDLAIDLEAFSFAPWLPATRNPERLFEAYSLGTGKMTRSAQEQLAVDLLHLALPPSLTRESFTLFVQAAMLRSKWLERVDSLLVQPRRFGQFRAGVGVMLREYDQHRDATELAQTLIRWMLAFLPSRYSVTVFDYSEVVKRSE